MPGIIRLCVDHKEIVKRLLNARAVQSSAAAVRILRCAGARKLHRVPVQRRLCAWFGFIKVACLLIQKQSGFVGDGGTEQGTVDQNLAGSDLANGFASSGKLCLILLMLLWKWVEIVYNFPYQRWTVWFLIFLITNVWTIAVNVNLVLFTWQSLVNVIRTECEK